MLKVDNGFVSVDDDIKDMVITTQSTRRSGEDTPRISATITITQADIKTVQNFLWNICEKAMIDKFRFDDSAAATSVSKGIIQVNEFDAHLAIVKQTFKLLLNEPDEKTKSLAYYMLKRLPLHLEFLTGATGANEIGSADKREIGKGVFTLFVDGDIIETYWDFFDWLPDPWFDNEGKTRISSFLKWLDDPEAIRSVGKKDKEWIKNIKEEPNPERSLLMPVTIMISRRWLQDREWSAWTTYRWIRAFLGLVGYILHLGAKTC